MKDKEVKEDLQRFADEHGITLTGKGECGFGRPCVGFLHGENYLDFNPLDSVNFEYIWGYDARLNSPSGTPNAYHKHNCMAVLVQGEDYDSALIELNEWVKHLESQGKISVEEFRTGVTGLQALFSGLTGHAIRIKEG